jgi:L-fucose isomerase-like protein
LYKEEKMEEIKVGFVPVHRSPFDLEWAKKMRKRCIDSFNKIEDIEIIYPDEKISDYGLLTFEKDAKSIIDFFKKEKIKGLIIGTMTFGEELPLLSVAEAFSDIPIFLFGTKEDPFTEDGFRHSDSFCGTLSASSGLYRRKIPFQFGGIVFPEENKFLEKVKNFSMTCSAFNGFIAARIGEVGPRPPAFETCTINEITMIERFRQRVIPRTLAEVFYEANKINNNDSAVKEIIAEIKANAICNGVPEESMQKLAKLEIVLMNFIKKEDLSCLGIQCWDAIEEIYGISPCLVNGRLTQKGFPVSCESDIHGALTMLLQYLVSLRKMPPHFIDWTIQHQEDNNKFFAWHCGNAPQCLAADKNTVRITKESIKSFATDNNYGKAEFQLKSGEVTLNRLVEYDGEFKLLITRGVIVPDSRKIRGAWAWVQVENLEKLFEVLVYEGFTHHASMVHGNFVDPLVEFCRFAGVTPVVV